MTLTTMRGGRSMLGVLAMAAIAIHATAADTSNSQQGESESAPVKVANRTVINLHGPVMGYSAKERAAASMERIEQSLRAANLPAISLEDMETGTRVLMGGNRVFTVLKIDADEDAGETPRLVAQEAVNRLETAIHERRE